MDVTLSIPQSIAERLQRASGDIAAALRESALVDLYRRGQITHFELAQALGLDRFAADGLLERHGVTEDLLTPDEHRRQVDDLRRLLDR